MVLMQIELTEKQNKIVEHAQVDWGFVDKRDAIKRIIFEWDQKCKARPAE